MSLRRGDDPNSHRSGVTSIFDSAEPILNIPVIDYYSGGGRNIGGRRTFAIVLIVILIASIILGSYAVYTEIESDTYETEWTFSNESSSTYGIIRSDPEGNIIALESNQYPLDGRHINYYVAIDPNGTLLWRFPINTEVGLTRVSTIGPDGGYYYRRLAGHIPLGAGPLISQMVQHHGAEPRWHDAVELRRRRWNVGDIQHLRPGRGGGTAFRALLESNNECDRMVVYGAVLVPAGRVVMGSGNSRY